MDIQESLSRILASKDELGKLFYAKFLTDHPELKPYFDKVDMKRQGIQLTTALMIIERYLANPTPAVELYLQYLGTKHHDLGIAKKYYPMWVATMCDTLEQFHGDQWNETLESQWREAFDRTIRVMFQGYETHVTV
jgi:hemoglobin-like flavoprotein